MKRVNSGMSSEIEQVVTNLLRTTKALLEALTQWSLQRASNSNIFEIHDTLEKQFFLVSQAFEEANVSMNDLQWIPGQLRESVSAAMMEAPSPASLDQYLPRIREVIVQLLHGLKGKQASLRERERESRIRASESWNREVPLAALNRGSSGSRMMYPPPSSPPLPPMASPRMNPHNSEYEPWGGGMPRPSIPTNDLSSRIMSPRNGSISSNTRPYSPPQRNHSNQGSPSLHAAALPSSPAMPLPTRSTSSNRSAKSPTLAYTIPTPPPPPPPPQPQVYPSQDVDENDPNTAIALAALKRQENLARRSSVRRASMFRGNGDNTGSINGGKQRYYENAPPVPNLPGQFNSKETKMDTVSETQENNGLSLFLQIGKQVKKIKYQGEISLPALNMLFLENFSYSSRQSDFPQIYIRDPAVGVAYELVDLSEVKDKSVLSLNINEEEEQKESQKEWLAEISKLFNKELNETKQSFTEQLENLKKQMEESTKTIDEAFKSSIQNGITVSEPAPNTTTPKDTPTNNKLVSKDKIDVQLNEIQTLRRDIAVLRQLESEMKEGTANVIREIKEKAAVVIQQSSKKSDNGHTSVARNQLEEGKTALLEKSEKVTTRLEDLQDTIDQLKLDVTQRKCRPSETQMTHCANERKALAQEIEEFGQFIAQVKPRWKKTWEQELQMIVKEQQTLKDQEYLLSDMKDDLDALCEVFEQLEKIYAYQAKTKPVAREFRVAPAEEGYEGMSSVFKQLESIDVDHDRRLRAMEQADKMRQRELANRTDDFEKELVTFVDAKKLKKTGGALEIDRLRKQKEEEMLKAMYNTQKNQNNSNNNPSPDVE